MGINISMESLFRGEMGAKFRHAVNKVVKNILDPNTPYKEKRSITLKIEFETNEDRDRIESAVQVMFKLAPEKKSKTTFMVGRNAIDNEIFIQEIGANIPGQMSVSDYGMDSTDDNPVPAVPFREAEPGTIIDFRR